jgi:hypothetical protein
MKHECGLCLRDNVRCKTGKSFIQLLLGKVSDCIIFSDYKGETLTKKQKRQKKVK